MKRKRILIIIASILGLLGLGYFLSKAKTTTETDKNTTGSKNSDDEEKDEEEGEENNGSGVTILPDGGEEEKLSKQLRYMNVRGTNTIISLWSNPYDTNEYFVKFNDIEVLKWTKVTLNPNFDWEKTYMPQGMTFLNTTGYPTLYKPYDVARVLKGGRNVEGYVAVAHEMLKDLINLTDKSPKVSLYL